MFFDNLMVLAGSYNPSTGAWTGQSPLTASVEMDNVIDLKPDAAATPTRHIVDSMVTFTAWATTTVTTGQTLTIDFYLSSDTTITTGDTLAGSMGAIATADLAVGDQPISVNLSIRPKTSARYLGGYFTEGGTIAAGAVVVIGTLDVQTNGIV